MTPIIEQPPETRQPEQAALDLWGGADRWPRRPYSTHDLEAGVRIRSLRAAITRPYIQANPPHLRVWSLYDIDRPGGALAWEQADLPPPAWAAANRANGHAHLAWGLSAPVLVDSLEARDAPMRYLAAIESCMRARLGGDHGYSGLITKNPMHPLWRVLRGPRLAYDLGELAEWLPEIARHRPRQGVSPERVGIGRNVAVFDGLRLWAYIEVRRWRDASGLQAWTAWAASVHARALIINADMLGERALEAREVWHIAKSVAKWVWRNGRAAVAKSDARWRETQARRGRAGGLVSGIRRAAAAEDQRASARLMRAAGHTQAQIAAALGVSDRTIRTWLQDPAPGGDRK